MARELCKTQLLRIFYLFIRRVFQFYGKCGKFFKNFLIEKISGRKPENMKFLSVYVIIQERCCHNGRRFALCGGFVILRLHKGGMPMSIIDLLAVLSFGLTCFSAGYNLGKDHKSQK